ncbi:hypothetical protein Gpo141_00015192, partial [Globisporangium polare]
MLKQVLACLVAIAVASTNLVQAEAQQTAEIILGSITIAQEVIPIIGDLIKNSQKNCRQVACWISTPSCYQSAADQVQNDIFQGRDGYSVESSGKTGAWVRYWRVRTGVSKTMTIASGKCSDGKPFSVSNCQTTGTVHC